MGIRKEGGEGGSAFSVSYPFSSFSCREEGIVEKKSTPLCSPSSRWKGEGGGGEPRGGRRLACSFTSSEGGEKGRKRSPGHYKPFLLPSQFPSSWGGRAGKKKRKEGRGWPMLFFPFSFLPRKGKAGKGKGEISQKRGKKRKKKGGKEGNISYCPPVSSSFSIRSEGRRGKGEKKENRTGVTSFLSLLLHPFIGEEPRAKKKGKEEGLRLRSYFMHPVEFLNFREGGGEKEKKEEEGVTQTPTSEKIPQ